MAKRIYVADDEKNICFLIQNFLEKEGFEVRCFEDGESILAACEEQMPDLCILDVMMPGMDGLTVCTRIRQKSHVPIIIVSAKDSPLDRITGITLGSDDYLVKPFLPLELVTRVKALFRRVDAFSGQEEENSENLELGDIVLYPGRRTASLKGEEFALTPLEFDFLRHMLEHPEHAASRDKRDSCKRMEGGQQRGGHQGGGRYGEAPAEKNEGTEQCSEDRNCMGIWVQTDGRRR